MEQFYLHFYLEVTRYITFIMIIIIIIILFIYFCLYLSELDTFLEWNNLFEMYLLCQINICIDRAFKGAVKQFLRCNSDVAR